MVLLGAAGRVVEDAARVRLERGRDAHAAGHRAASSNLKNAGRMVSTICFLFFLLNFPHFVGVEARGSVPAGDTNHQVKRT